MSQISGIPLLDPPKTMAEMQAAKPKQGEGIIPAIGDVLATESTVSRLYDFISRGSYPPDPKFVASEDLFKRMLDGIPEHQWPAFGTIRSEDEGWVLRNQLLADNERRMAVQTSTHPTIAALAGGLLDPAYLAAGLVTGGAAEAIAPALGSGRIAMLGAKGIVNLGTVAAVETGRAAIDPEDDFTRSMIHGGLGVLAIELAGHGIGSGFRGGNALIRKAARLDQKAVELNEAVGITQHTPFAQGVGAGAASSAELTPEFQAIMSRHNITEAAREMVTKKLLTPEAETYFANAMDVKAPGEFVENLAHNIGLNEAEHPEEMRFFRENARDIYDLQFRTPSVEPPNPRGAYSGGPMETPEEAAYKAEQAAAMSKMETNRYAERKAALEASGGKRPGRPPGDQPPPEEPPPPPPPHRGDYFPDLSGGYAFGKRLFTPLGSIGKSVSEMARDTISALFKDPLAKTAEPTGWLEMFGLKKYEPLPSNQSMDEYIKRKATDLKRAYYGVYKANLEAWLVDQRVPNQSRALAEDQFNTLLTHAQQDPKFSADPRVQAVAENTRKLLRDHGDFLVRHGVMDDASIIKDGSYFPWHVKANLIEAGIAQYGEKEMYRLFGESWRDLMLTPEERMIRGKYWVDAARQSDRIKIDDAGGPSNDIIATMEKKMRADGIPEDRIRHYLYDAVDEGRPTGPSFTQKRANLDRVYKTDLTRVDGQGVDTVNVSDFIDNDHKHVMGSYFEGTVRKAAEKKFLTAMEQKYNLLPNTTFDELRAAIIDHSQNAGMDKNAVLVQDAQLEQAHKLVMGKPIEIKTPGKQLFSTVRAYNSMRLSGMFGVAQLPQTGIAMAINGLRSVAAHAPAYAEMLSTIRSGEASSDVLRAIDHWSAADADLYGHRQFMSRLDESATAMDRVQNFAQRASDVTNSIAGTQGINRLNKRMAGFGALDMWGQIAASGKLPNAAKLGQLGMDEATAQKIVDAFRDDKLSHWETGEVGEKLRMPDLDKWDARLASKFTTSIDRWSSQAAHDFTYGSSAGWMNKEWGKVLTQFRVFHLQAWDKQFLARLQANDVEAWTGASYAMLMGGMVYAAQQYVKSMTLPVDERQDYRDKMLSWERIGAAAYARSGFSGVMPSFIDTAQHITGGKPIFDQSSYSGTASDLLSLDTNPTSKLVKEVGEQTLPRLFGPLRETVAPEGSMLDKVFGSANTDKHFDRATAKAMLQLAPLRRHIVAQQIYDVLENQFPEHERR